MKKGHMRETICCECDGSATVSRRNHRFDQFGIPVELCDIEVISCPKCGDTPVIPHMNEMMDTLATAVLCNPRSLTGAEVRFLRKYANKSAREFARYLHVDHTSLSKIENESRKLAPSMDRLVRLTVAGLQENLGGEINDLVEMMLTIKERCPDDDEDIVQIDPAKGTYEYA